MTKKGTAIIQARMASTRLPGKVMMEVLGKPLLVYLVERLMQVEFIDRMIVATTKNPEDDVIADHARKLGLLLFRGAEHNVLDRFYGAAAKFGVDHILRITADCPLIDPGLVDSLMGFYFSGGFDYACNCDPPTLPDGLDAEVFSFTALEVAHKNALLPSELEHVTPYIRNNPECFKIGRWRYSRDLSHLRWTVDEPEDFLFVKEVLESLYPLNRDFRTRDIVRLLAKKPELCKINAFYQRNEGALKSQIEDEKYMMEMRM